MAALWTPNTSPLGNAALGWAFACSRTGASHVRSGTPCQDAYALWSGALSGQECLIAAVADGHGDNRHDQSEFGAFLAVRAAVDELLSLQTHFGSDGLFSHLISTFKEDFPRRLGRRWREAVIADALSRGLKDSVETQDQQPLFVRYGTTLLAALVLRNKVLLGQIGDGSILFLESDSSVSCPLAREEPDLGNEVDSLCSTEANKLWRTATCDCSEGGHILLTTDGLVNTFVDNTQLFAFAGSVAQRIRDFGVMQVASALPAWLDHYSTHGSGDDITLAVLMIKPKPTGEEGTRVNAAELTQTNTDDQSEQSKGDDNAADNRTEGLRGDSKDPLRSEKETG